VRVKKILLSIIATLLTVALPGCGAGGTTSDGTGPSKTYNLEGGTVTFTTPAAPWVEKKGMSGEADAQPGAPDGETVGVSFHKPESQGFFAVGTMAQNAKVEKDASGKEIGRKLIDLENDQDTLDVIAYWVIKRDGKILNQDYIPFAGGNAYWMEFELGKPEERMKGQQVHLTKDGTHYTLSMMMPSKDYDTELKQFQTMISSFKLESSGKPPARPAATPAPTP
jgi:hypothetical protein